MRIGRTPRVGVLAVLAGSLTLPAVVRSQEPTVPAGAPPVEALVAEALARSPRLAARVAEVTAAREAERPAGALPDPVLEVMLQDAGFPDWTVGEEPMSMIGPQLSQGLPFPGKRGARRTAAAARTDVRRAERDAAAREVVRDVRQAYARVYAIDRERVLLDASRDLTEVLAATASHHLEMGEMDQEAVVRVRVVASRLEERRADLAAARAAAVAELNRLLDRPGDAPLGEVVELPRPPAPARPGDGAAEGASAEVAVRAATVTAAEAALRAARLETRPDFMAGAGVGLRGDLDPVVTFRVGVELPVWQGAKQRPLARAAAAERDAALEEARDARAAARAEAERRHAELLLADEQVARYEDSLVPQTLLAFDAARAAYLGRRADFSTVLEDFDLWLDARAGLARREAERYAAWAALDFLLHPAADAGGDTP